MMDYESNLNDTRSYRFVISVCTYETSFISVGTIMKWCLLYITNYQITLDIKLNKTVYFKLITQHTYIVLMS